MAQKLKIHFKNLAVDLSLYYLSRSSMYAHVEGFFFFFFRLRSHLIGSAQPLETGLFVCLFVLEKTTLLY